MIDQDYRIVSDAEHASAIANASTNLVVANAGTVVASPRLRVVGPVTGAPLKLRNVTAGLELRMKAGFALAGGEVLEIDTAPPYPRVTVDGDEAYGEVDFLPTDWWGLVPGNNTIRLEPGATGTLQVFHRDAWI
jgi:hypothetical protein